VQKNVRKNSRIETGFQSIADPEAAAAYVRLKNDLAQRFRNDRERYTEAKTDFIRSFLESP